MGMYSNICLGCRFSSIKIDVSIPKSYDMKNLAQETKAFSSKIVVQTKQKPIHYNLTVDNQKHENSLGFNLDCICILNIKKDDCSKFNPTHQKTLRIKHIQNRNLHPTIQPLQTPTKPTKL